MIIIMIVNECIRKKDDICKNFATVRVQEKSISPASPVDLKHSYFFVWPRRKSHCFIDKHAFVKAKQQN